MMSFTYIDDEGRELLVKYSFQPYEPVSSDREYGGCPAGFDEIIVTFQGEDVEFDEEEMERLCMEDMEAYSEY